MRRTPSSAATALLAAGLLTATAAQATSPTPPASAGTVSSEPGPAGTVSPQPAPAGTVSSQPAPAGTVSPQPAPAGTGALSTPAGSAYRAVIRRTTDGVPHITGDRLGDVIFGQGYANAQDHGCTLADAVLTPLARRAATFGPGTKDANVDSDFAWESIGLADLAAADFTTASSGVREMMTAYAAGWNRYLAEHPGGFTGWCAGQDWVRPITPVELYTYGRWVTLLASSASLARLIPSAQPPAPAAPGSVPTSSADGPARMAAAWAEVSPQAASNAWAIGADDVTGGSGGMLIGNPHFPWEGSLRFWEVQLTTPAMNIYGAMLIGLPGVGVGFTKEFAWSHTVSAGARFTGYLLDLDPADPTRYLVDGVSVPMTSTDYTVDVRQPDGTTVQQHRRLYHSEYGPIVNFPGLGWTTAKTLTFRDANLNNDEFVDQYLAMDTATTFDEFIAAHRTHQGVPLFNTIAVSRDGRAWYADTSATPKLSPAAEAKYRQALATDPITKIAKANGAVLLNGSDSTFRWAEVPGARDPGLVPFDEMPQVERGDYVFNANDSFWMYHATERLSGGYSILHGEQDTVRSLRTRENAEVLSEGASGPAGSDGTWTSAELRAAALYDRVGSARLLRPAVAARCAGATVVDVPQLDGPDGAVALPAEAVDVAPACAVLTAWDGFDNTDSVGAVLWHELMSAVRRDVEGGLDGLWAVPFDPADALHTPSGLKPAADPVHDPVLMALARAVQTLTKAGLAVDVRLGAVQYALRATEHGPRIGLGGGSGPDGLTNVVDYSRPGNTTEPVADAGDPVVPGSDLRPSGYPVDRGTSFLFNVDFTSGQPRAWAILTYGETGDRSSPLFTVQTQRFADKNWRQVAFTDAEIDADPALTSVTVTG